MRHDVRQKLAINSTSTLEDRTIDITTTGRRTGDPGASRSCSTGWATTST